MNNYNKNIIFDLAISGKDLTTKELLNQGLTNNDLGKLVKDKVLIRIGRGLYQVEVTSLNDYIMDLLKRGEIEKSLLGLNLNLQIDESLAETNYIMILALIMKEDYQKTFPYLRRLIQGSDLDYFKEAIFLLYLLILLLFAYFLNLYLLCGSLHFLDIYNHNLGNMLFLYDGI